MLFEKLGICLSGRRIARFLVCIRRGWNSHSLCNKFRELSLSLSLFLLSRAIIERQIRSSRYLTNFFTNIVIHNFLSDSFFFLSFFHSAAIYTTIRNTGRLSYSISYGEKERGPGIILPAIEKAPVKSRSSSCGGSMTRAIRRGSRVAGKRERHSSEKEWWTKKRNGIDRGLSMSPFYRRSYIIVALSPFHNLLNSAVSFLLRGNTDTRACDLYGEIESAIIESPPTLGWIRNFRFPVRSY